MAKTISNSVLVVDDSPEQIRFVSELLKTEGCRIYAALSCEDAFEVLEKQIPSLILLDIVMPGMDGFTFCRIMKQDDRWKDIPVIFATAYHDEEYLTRGFEAGGCDYVVKPFIKEELLERVKVRIRLSQKRIELQKAYSEMDTFCYTLSHDIRAPLYVIRQLASMLSGEIDEGNYDEVKKICGMIEKKASRAADMTDGLHKFSKALYAPLNYEQINMDKLFREVYKEQAMLQGDRKIVYEQEKLPVIYADMVLIRVALMNVLSNALKFTAQESEAWIHVYSEERESEIAYCVQDNGVGFDEKDASEMFGVFHRLHGEEFSGDGIGLATVKRIVDRHNGTVEIFSKPQQETCIKIVLKRGEING